MNILSLLFALLALFVSGSVGDLIGYNRGQNNVNILNMSRHKLSSRRYRKNYHENSKPKPSSNIRRLLLQYLSER